MARWILGFLTSFFLLALLGLFLTWSGIFPVSAKAAPPAWEKRIASFALGRCLARQATERANPLPVTEANLEKGMETYRMNCSVCHGDVLNKSKWGTTSFYPRVPQFGKRSIRAPESLIYWIEKNGIKYTGMSSFDTLLTDKEMWQVAMFLHRLDSLPPKINAEWHTPPEN